MIVGEDWLVQPVAEATVLFSWMYIFLSFLLFIVLVFQMFRSDRNSNLNVSKLTIDVGLMSKSICSTSALSS